MNQNKQLVRFLALTIPVFVGIEIVGAIFLPQPVNTDVLVQNTEVQNSDSEEQLVSDSKSGGSARQNSSKMNEDSLFDALTEYDNLFDLKQALLRFVDDATQYELVEIFHEVREYPLAFESIHTTHWLRSVVLSKLFEIDSDKVQSLIEQLDEQTAQIVVYGVMSEWPQMYEDEAVKFLALFDTGLKRQGLLGLIDGSTSLHRSRVIEMGRELGFQEDYLTGLLDQHLLARDHTSLDNIATELENTISKGDFDFREAERKAVNFVLAQGLDSLPRVLEVFDAQSKGNMSQSTRMFFNGARSRLVSDIAVSDPEQMFEYLVSLGEALDVDLLSAVSDVWFGSDPETLWNRLEGTDLQDIRHDVIEDIIGRWTLREPDLALVSLEKFPPEYHDLVYVEVALEVAKASPFHALELLRETSDWSQTRSDREERRRNSDRSVAHYFAIDRIIASATRASPNSTIDWIESEESHLDDSMKQQFLDDVFQVWSKSDPYTAFEMAQQMPLSTDTAGFEATVLGSMGDVDQAIEWLTRVREGETKTNAYRRVMWRLQAQDRISDALELGSALPEHERKEYNEALARNIGHREPFDHLIAGIRALPSQELQVKAIRTRLLFIYLLPDTAPKITNKQLDQFKEFLTERENRLLDMGRRMFKDLIHEDLSE
ncbi:MAG: hypothetical protein F4W92_06585 [Gammaproteobacteria bacterium]|nr:hypothetical protein [Gammaproteobacteria bacterium]